MQIIVNDDQAYASWITHHHHGFVLDCPKPPARGHCRLHLANCPLVKPRKRAAMTTGRRVKACALDPTDLIDWAAAMGCDTRACETCTPEHPPGGALAPVRLTRLGGDVLSYVVDLAVMFLDGEQPRFEPTIEAVAGYLGKSAPQLLPAVRRLSDDGYLALHRTGSRGRLYLLPTAQAMRTVPAFAELASEQLDQELARLAPPLDAAGG